MYFAFIACHLTDGIKFMIFLFFFCWRFILCHFCYKKKKFNNRLFISSKSFLIHSMVISNQMCYKVHESTKVAVERSQRCRMSTYLVFRQISFLFSRELCYSLWNKMQQTHFYIDLISFWYTRSMKVKRRTWSWKKCMFLCCLIIIFVVFA